MTAVSPGAGPQTVRGLDAVTPGASVVTIGNFDGVHRGHQVLLRRTADAARERGVRAVAVTFDPHPAAVLRPGSEPPALVTLDERTDRLGALGIDLVVVLPFTEALAGLAPEEFVREVLGVRLAAVRVIVGTNFRFGHRAAGDVVTLVETGDEHGFEVEAVTLFELEGIPVSSSTIRDHLAAGDVAWVGRALGRPHAVAGTVVSGDGRGRTIGFPTANLAVDPPVAVPGGGVYAGRATTGAVDHPCVVNIGTGPTFGDGQARRVEVHLLDTELDLYGERLTVAFAHRLRAEQRFAGPDELVAQIRRDIDRARELVGDASR